MKNRCFSFLNFTFKLCAKCLCLLRDYPHFFYSRNESRQPRRNLVAKTYIVTIFCRKLTRAFILDRSERAPLHNSFKGMTLLFQMVACLRRFLLRQLHLLIFWMNLNTHDKPEFDLRPTRSGATTKKATNLSYLTAQHSVLHLLIFFGCSLSCLLYSGVIISSWILTN